MNFLEYESAAMRTSKIEDDVSGLNHAALGLAAEGGEFISEVKRVVAYGKAISPEMHAHMVEELGDALWFIAKGCHHLGVSMHSVAKQNIAKLQARFPEKFSAGAAEARADKGGLPHTES